MMDFDNKANPKTLVLKICSKSEEVTSSIFLKAPIPALLIRASILPSKASIHC